MDGATDTGGPACGLNGRGTGDRRCVAGAWLPQGTCSNEPDAFAEFEPGEFLMGNPEDEPGRFRDEQLHLVTIEHGFWLQRTEVTRAEWVAPMGNRPWESRCVGETCPVENVNWFEAAAFANVRSVSEGLPACYRLRRSKRWAWLAAVIGCPGVQRRSTALSPSAIVVTKPAAAAPTNAGTYPSMRGGTGTNHALR